jgi:hypothetical protein
MKCLVVDQQLAVEQVQFLDAGMAMRWIVDTRRQAHQHADTVSLCVGGEQLD